MEQSEFFFLLLQVISSLVVRVALKFCIMEKEYRK